MDAEIAGRPLTRPRLVDAGIVVALLGALVNLVIGVLLVVAVRDSRVPVPGALAALVVAITVLFSAAVVTCAVAFRRGRSWGRAGILVLSALSLLTLFAPNAVNLIVVVLLVVADVLLYRRPVSAWVRAEREARAR